MVEKTIDIIIGIAVFTSIIIFSTAALYNHFSQTKSISENDQLSFEVGKFITVLLESPGSPVEWQVNNNPSIPGLALYDPLKNETLDYTLHDLKVASLFNLSYSTLKKELGVSGVILLKVTFQPENWANKSFPYRIPVYIDNSSSNASLEVLLPRAHATSVKLYDNLKREVSFSGNVISYYGNSYIKKMTVNFSTTGKNLYFLYYSPENISSLPSKVIQNSSQKAEAGKEEMLLNFTTGKIPKNKTFKIISSSVAYISSPRIAYIGNIPYEEDIIKNMGFRVINFSSANIGDLFNLSYKNNLYTFDTVVVGTDATLNPSINGNLTVRKYEIYNYVLKGGGLCILGQDSGYNFISPFYIEAIPEGGINQTLVESYLSILNFPNNLSVTYPSSQDSIYLSERQVNAPLHPLEPSYTFWSLFKPYNLTPYKSVFFASVNNSYISNSSFIADGDFSTDPSSVWSNSTSSSDIINAWTSTGNQDLVYTAQSYTNTASIDGYANWSQSVYYGGRIVPEIANLSFAWKIYSYSDALPSKLYIYIKTPSGREYNIWQANYNSTTLWKSENIDISPLLKENGSYTLTLSAWIKTGDTGGEANHVLWDNISLSTSYMPVIWMGGRLGDGKLVITGDEPYYSGHNKLLENIIYYLLPKKMFRGHIARFSIGVGD